MPGSGAETRPPTDAPAVPSAPQQSRSEARPSSGTRADPGSAPLVELQGLGIWYRRHTRRQFSIKEGLRALRAFVSGAWRRHAVHWALRDIDLMCHEGEVLGVVGPNGAGKSTLCLVLAGILTPDEGAARIRGKVSTLLTLGAGLERDLTGRENIRLYGTYLGIRRVDIDARMDGIIEFSELGDFIDEPIRSYSSGMRARLAFSVATALEPEILILDEVLSVGDRAFRAKTRRRIEELMQRSRLIVVVSHSNRFLREICTHCLWLDGGRLVRHGPASEVLDAYAASTVAAASSRSGAGTPDRS